MTDTEEIDGLVEALRAAGWDRPTTTTVLAAEDRAAAEALFGATNARRMAEAPRGSRVRMVRVSEIYVVRNTRGWLIGAIEGRRNRPLYEGLTNAERARVVQFARQRGYRVIEYDNPTPPPIEAGSIRRPERPISAVGYSKPSTPSGRVQPSRRLALIQQLGKFHA